jgi:DNA-binding transcriptional ArsR family regulator
MVEPAGIDVVLRALADPTRRAVFERIARSNEMNVTELTWESGVSQGAISQHLKQLRSAGLIIERPQGRKVFYRAKPDGLAPLLDWLTHYDAFWRDRFADLRVLLKEIDP